MKPSSRINRYEIKNESTTVKIHQSVRVPCSRTSDSHGKFLQSKRPSHHNNSIPRTPFLIITQALVVHIALNSYSALYLSPGRLRVYVAKLGTLAARCSFPAGNAEAKMQRRRSAIACG